MMHASELVLRDVHVPAAPTWWPPAPGWWILAVGLMVLIIGLLVWQRHRRRRLQAWHSLFDTAIASDTSSASVAAMSELLRRAARQVDPSADKLQGQQWLIFLDGSTGKEFSDGAGRLLLDGGFRAHVDAQEQAALASLARTRFLRLMAGKR